MQVAGADINGMGYPGMGQYKSKYGRSYAIWKDPIDLEGQLEGAVDTFIFKGEGALFSPLCLVSI